MDELWLPIKGYEGVYWISQSGKIKNSRGKLLHPFKASAGKQVELRHNGQRERFIVSELLKSMFGGSCND